MIHHYVNYAGNLNLYCYVSELQGHRSNHNLYLVFPLKRLEINAEKSFDIILNSAKLRNRTKE